MLGEKTEGQCAEKSRRQIGRVGSGQAVCSPDMAAVQVIRWKNAPQADAGCQQAMQFSPVGGMTPLC